MKAEAPTDEDLGIGEDDAEESAADAGDGSFEALLNDPRMAKLLDAAVAARMAQMGVGANGGSMSSDTLTAFTETIRHLIDTQAEQRPGYIKPLPAAEVDRRAAGFVEMNALLRDYQAKDDELTRRGLTPIHAPLWTVGEGGFFECTHAQEFEPGARIRTYLPPPEDFIPENESASKVQAAVFQWLGDRTPHIGDQLEAAQRAAKALPPLVMSGPDAAPPRGLVELVDPPKTTANTRRRRAMGTIVPEGREISLAERAAGGPVGPSFQNVGA